MRPDQRDAKVRTMVAEAEQMVDELKAAGWTHDDFTKVLEDILGPTHPFPKGKKLETTSNAGAKV